MTIRFSTGTRQELLGENGVEAGADGLKGIFKDGIIELRTGAQPASADNAVAGTLLGTITVGAGAFTAGVATNGLEFDAPVAGVLSKAAAETWQLGDAAGVAGAEAAGTAGWFRFKANAVDAGGSSATLARIDGNIAKTGGDLNLSVIVFVIGTPVTIDTFAITLKENASS